MDGGIDKELTLEGIKKIIEFLPIFKDKGFKASKLYLKEGVFPSNIYSEEVTRFLNVLYMEGFIYPFDWSNWDYGRKLTSNSELIKKAKLLTLRKLLTAHTRYDRFCEGHLASIFESGLIVRILKRLEQLL
jgi:hypothetical protein